MNLHEGFVWLLCSGKIVLVLKNKHLLCKLLVVQQDGDFACDSTSLYTLLLWNFFCHLSSSQDIKKINVKSSIVSSTCIHHFDFFKLCPVRTTKTISVLKRGHMTCFNLSTLDFSYLIGSKLHPGFSFHQSCIYLHNDRFYGIGTAPALKNTTPHNNIPWIHLYLLYKGYCVVNLGLDGLPVLWEVPCTRPLLPEHNWYKTTEQC